MANIVFTDPPPRPQRASAHPWHEIAHALRERPGEWALVLRGIHSSYSSQINHGKLTAFAPAGAFEARSVSTLSQPDNPERKVHDLYVRFIGETKSEADNT